ncbi:hypothetical protein QBC47DRAFT_372030 [Echria macrotheca]|uniref:Pentatricopeptide repeat-containing protein n=1 Tax=Echria macrotheca TaxID=438768 RepID=A0AAJ0F9V3_9PEZI|nr:hypothetical protein QBC47DRAFT_372030 [Echria macrotheca]
MSSPLPVPSKAALTALRGLLVGTSCTLALIAEDRRRRINNALRAIDNGAKVKSARSYHSGGTAFALALEEEALSDMALPSPAWPDSPEARPRLRIDHLTGLPLPREGKERLIPTSPATPEDWSVTMVAAEVERTSVPTSRTGPATARPKPFVEQWPDRTSEKIGAIIGRSNGSGDVDSSSKEIITTIWRACDSRDSQLVSRAVEVVLSAYRHGTVPQGSSKRWARATAQLSWTCQELGLLRDAVRLLETVGSHEATTEAEYFAHKPMRLIGLLLDQVDLMSPDGRSLQSADWYARRKILTSARTLFRPMREIDTPGSRPGVVDTGKRLIESLIGARMVPRSLKILRDCVDTASDESANLRGWYVAKLLDDALGNGGYKFAILQFLDSYDATSKVGALLRTGDAVVECVSKANGYKAADVLKKLFGLCSGVCQPRVNWVASLLRADWESHESFGSTETLFNELVGKLDPATEVPWVDIYRIMVELALKTGEMTRASYYLEKMEERGPEVNKDTRLLGILAKHHAKLGEWTTVRNLFESMKVDTIPDAEICSKAFVPVLKAFADSHSMRETERFLRSYIEELKVPLSPYSVTLMAKHYAQIRDYEAVLRWLEYCTAANVPAGASFANTILQTCRHAGMRFQTLRALYQKLTQLNPAFVNRDTERIMAGAALTDKKCTGKLAQRRLRSLKLKHDFLPPKLSVAFTNEDDVVLAMRKAMAQEEPMRVVRLYKTAVQMGVPLTPRTPALRLAIQAALSIGSPDKRGDRGDRLHDLLRFAEEHGHDINYVMNHVIAAQLKEIYYKDEPARTRKALGSTLAFFEARGIVLADVTLNRVADRCLKIGFWDDAISYATKAANARGFSRPCYNIHNFRTFLFAYIHKRSAEGIDKAVELALGNGCVEELEFLQTLKFARKVIRSRWPETASGQDEALASIQKGIQTVVEKRKAQREQRTRLEKKGLRMLQQAVQDAGRPRELDSVSGLDLDEARPAGLFGEARSFAHPVLTLVPPASG